jgi:hypothetical protein
MEVQTFPERVCKLLRRAPPPAPARRGTDLEDAPGWLAIRTKSGEAVIVFVMLRRAHPAPQPTARRLPSRLSRRIATESS